MLKLFKKRKSVRSFDPEKLIEKEKINEILEAADSAPSAGGLKARKIIIVTERDKKEWLVAASFDQKQILEAPAVFVFVALPEASAKKYAERGRDLYAVQDATLAAGFAWLQAVDLGLAGGWIGGFEEEQVREILDLEENEKPVVILPVGYAR